MRACDVCRLLDYDTSPKMCSYCPLCDAWICQGDGDKWGRRIKAALKRKREPGYQGHPDYEQVSGYAGEEK
jgi:hypothetical protein